MNSSKHPEYVVCIKHTHEDKPNTSWCGNRLWSHEFNFQSVDHALYNGLNGGRLQTCNECSLAVTQALNAGTYGAR